MEITTSRKIGLIGGLSYPSTTTYYERLNQLVNDRLGKAHSARIVLESLDFQPVAHWLATGNNRAVVGALRSAAGHLEASGAELIAMCCNTVHKFAPEVKAGMQACLINICEFTAKDCARRGFRTVALLGSAFTMEEPFYRDEFARVGVDVIVPDRADRRFMQHAIETELSLGEVSATTRDRFLRIALGLCNRQADALVLACTEIPLVLQQKDVEVPVIDTVELHCAAIVECAFSQPHQTLGAEPCAMPF